jgi:hypothetical protein
MYGVRRMSKVNPAELEINRHLEDARPLTKEAFRSLKQDKMDPEELSVEEREFYESVVDLAKSIKKNGQYYPSTCRQVGPDQLELVTGYRRFLACLYAGKAVEVETRRMSDDDVLHMIYDENENRSGLNPYDRAVVLAKKMGRWSEEEGFVPPEHQDADPNADTIAEFAEETGKNHGLIYQHLSPLRQDQTMRKEFADEICESSFTLIERITDDHGEQYTLAQALYQSPVDTHSSFKNTYKMAQKQASDNMVGYICRKLIGVKEEDVKGSFLEKRKQKTLAQKKRQEIEDKSRETAQAGQKMSFDDVQNQEMDDVQIGGPEDDSDEGLRRQRGLGHGEESGTSSLPPKHEQPNQDTRIEDISVPAGREIARLVRDECEDRDIEPSEFVTEVLEIHFRREGLLNDTPEAIQAD